MGKPRDLFKKMGAIKGTLGFADSSVGKESTAIQQTPVWFLNQEDPLEKGRLPTPVFLGFPCGSAGKESACNAGDLSSIPGLGRSAGEGKDYPLQYSGLEKSMDCIVHGVGKNQTRLSNLHFSLSREHFHARMGTIKELLELLSNKNAVALSPEQQTLWEPHITNLQPPQTSAEL